MSAVMEHRDDVQPVANERLDRVLTGTVHRRALPRRGRRGRAGVAAVPPLERRDHLRGALRPDGARHHRRLSSAAHAPGVQDEDVVQGDARRARLGGDRGAGDLLGRRPPQAPRVRRPGGRPALAARRSRARLSGRAARASRTRISGGCSCTRSAARRNATRRTSSRTPRSASSTARSSCGWSIGLALPFVLGVRDRRLARDRADGDAVGRVGARVPAAPRDLLDQLAVPLLRAPAASRPKTSRATCSGCRRSRCGESWHNNHHAFPTSLRHGMKPWELDVSAGVIWAMEKTGLAWDVVRIPPERQARKAVGP